MTNIIVDTNCFVSLLDTSDKWNKTSIEIYSKLNKFNINLLLTHIVLNEAINVICKRLENKGRSNEMKEFIGLIENKFSSNSILWISQETKKYHNKIIKLVSENNGLLNYNDCFLIAYMQKNKINTIISFDNDFDSIEGINRISNKLFQLK